MIYEYNCASCEKNFDVVKHHSKHQTPESCPYCSGQTKKLFSTPAIPTMERAEFNHGLGCVVKNKQHRAEICKRKGLVEIGNEASKNIHKHSEDTLKKNLSWDKD